MGLALRQSIRGSLFRSLRDLAATDDEAAAAASGGGTTTQVDPRPLFHQNWDLDYATLAANPDNSGGVPADGADLGFVSVAGLNPSPGTVVVLNAASDGVHAKHVKHSDGFGNFASFDRPSARNLKASPSGGLGGPIPLPYTRISCIYVPASAAAQGAIMGWSNVYSGVLGIRADTLEMWNGGAGVINLPFARDTWAIVVEEVQNGAARGRVNLGPWVTAANIGNAALGSGLTIGGYANDANEHGTGSWRRIYLHEGLFTDAQLDGFVAWMGAKIGLTL